MRERVLGQDDNLPTELFRALLVPERERERERVREEAWRLTDTSSVPSARAYVSVCA